jgi:hypothetical protein
MKFISSIPALAYDAKNDRVVRIVISVDEHGRRWESYDGGPDTPRCPSRTSRAR